MISREELINKIRTFESGWALEELESSDTPHKEYLARLLEMQGDVDRYAA